MIVVPLNLKIIGQSIHFCYTSFVQPKSINEDDRRREFILTVILLGSIVTLACLDALVVYATITKGSMYTGVSLLMFSSILACFIAMYVLTRNGRARVISFVLIGAYALTNSYAVYRWGINLPSSLLSYAVIIVISSILINTKFGFVVTGTLMILTTATAYLQEYGIYHPNLSWRIEAPEAIDGIKYSILFLLLMLISWLSNREIERSLVRARKSEQELKVERDVLEVKVEERTRQLKVVQMEKMNQLYQFAEFGKLSTGLFHDLLNPLTSVCLNISKLQTVSESNTPAVRQHLEMALQASKRMESFAGKIRRQISRSSQEENFDTMAEVQEMIELQRFNATRKYITISVKDAPPTMSAFGNPVKFRQIVSNLVSNAIDSFGNPADSIPQGRETEKRQILLTFSEDSEGILMQVADNGCGISPSIIPRIFEPFFTTKPVDQGTGFGLPMIKELIEKDFGGTIEVTSVMGHGTIFQVKFPKHVQSRPINHLPSLQITEAPKT